MSESLDLTGQVFGRLTAIRSLGPRLTNRKNHKQFAIFWECLCSCGDLTQTRSNYLLSGHTRSCGCLRREMYVKNRKPKTTKPAEAIDMTGEVVGWLTVLRRVENNNLGQVVWLCKCKCGTETRVTRVHLKNGHTRSCGCYKSVAQGVGGLDPVNFRRTPTRKNRKHGLVGTRLYRIWKGMRQRCYYVNGKDYKRWGGRGITVCKVWRDSPEAFVKWSLANGYADYLQLDRRNNDGPYSPRNCRWVTSYVNNNNRAKKKVA